MTAAFRTVFNRLWSDLVETYGWVAAAPATLLFRCGSETAALDLAEVPLLRFDKPPSHDPVLTVTIPEGWLEAVEKGELRPDRATRYLKLEGDPTPLLRLANHVLRQPEEKSNDGK